MITEEEIRYWRTEETSGLMLAVLKNDGQYRLSVEDYNVRYNINDD